jgi:Thiamine pyrophosphate enzyme, N-terminal TPP binding domain
MYTTSSVFLKTLAEAGITHVFVNWGSDHPGLLEELAQRSREGKYKDMNIITIPNEMAGLFAAQGFAQVTGKPAALVVHVDAGTQVSIYLTMLCPPPTPPMSNFLDINIAWSSKFRHSLMPSTVSIGVEFLF